MPTAITNDIKITVEVFYKGTQSEIDWVNMYAYRISIENRGDYTAKLLRRHWYINDIGFDQKEVEGEGVVGEGVGAFVGAFVGAREGGKVFV